MFQTNFGVHQLGSSWHFYKTIILPRKALCNINEEGSINNTSMHLLQRLAAILALVYCLILPVRACGDVQPIGIDFGPEIMSVLPAPHTHIASILLMVERPHMRMHLIMSQSLPRLPPDGMTRMASTCVTFVRKPTYRTM
jgi:hypothetical protein